MNSLPELNQMYVLQLSTLKEAKRLYKILKDEKILNRVNDRKFREFLKQGSKELWKSYLCLKKAYKKEEKLRSTRHQLMSRNKSEGYC